MTSHSSRKPSQTSCILPAKPVSDKMFRPRFAAFCSSLALGAMLAVPGAVTAASYVIQNVGNPAQVGGFANALNNAGIVATTSLVKSYTFGTSAFTSPQEIVIANVATSTPGVVAQGINDLGEIVGRYRIAGNPANQTSGFILRANGTMDVYNAPNMSSTSISMMNDLGAMVGETRSDLTAFGVIRGFLYQGGNFSEVHVPGAALTRAYGINDSGLIVGQYQNSDEISRPFLLSGGLYTELTLPNAPGGAVSAIAFSVSDNGSILGTYRDNANATKTWVRLPDGSFAYPELPGSGSGRAINDAGQISGSYLDPANGNARTAFLATPVPEPSALMMASAAGFLLLRRSKRNASE